MRLFRYMRPHVAALSGAALLLAVAGALMGAVFATMKPLVNGVLLDRDAPPAAGEAAPGAERGFDILERVRRWIPDGFASDLSAWVEREAFVQVPILIVAVFFLRAVCMYFGEYLTTRAGAKIIRAIRADLFDAIVRQSLVFFQVHPTGQILSRVLNDVARLQKVVTTVLADMLRVGAQIPFLVIVLLLHDWRLSLLAIAAVPLLAWPMARFGVKLRVASRRSQESMGVAADVLAETVSGVKVVQGFGMESHESARLDRALSGLLKADLKAGRAAAVAPAVLEFAGAIVGAVLFAVAGYHIHRGNLDPGDFAVVLGGLGYLFMSVRRLNRLNVEFQQARAASRRVFDMMDEERAVRDAPDAIELPGFEREVRFDGVRFAYERDAVLDGIDLVLAKGEVVALVGPSGSGKSTLANLVPRFYDPTEGAVSIDGHDLRTVTLASLRSRIGIVTQETVLFNDTVRGNIAYGRDDVPDDRLDAVARAAQVEGFVRAMPEGYETIVGERGARLSMGQRQRITIARALLKDPPILILDEATSALDAESEAKVQAALDRLMDGRTCLVIAHRLATVRRADRILVLEHGRIVEQGDHETLVAAGGRYADLCRLQFAEDAG